LVDFGERRPAQSLPTGIGSALTLSLRQAEQQQARMRRSAGQKSASGWAIAPDGLDKMRLAAGSWTDAARTQRPGGTFTGQHRRRL